MGAGQQMTELSDIVIPYTTRCVVDGGGRPEGYLVEVIECEGREESYKFGAALLRAGLLTFTATAWHPDPNVRHPVLRSPTQTVLELRGRVVRPGRDLGDHIDEERRMAVQQYAMRVQGMSELEAALVSQRFLNLLAKENTNG